MLGSSNSVKVRNAKVGDAKALAAVFRESWLGAYLGIIPHPHLENMIRRRNVRAWASSMRAGEPVLVLEFEGNVAGYATLGASRKRGPYQGEIYELYLSPTYQGLGFGELLFEACRNRLDERRLKGLVVWALSANTAATDFYWRRGGRPFAKTYEAIGGVKLEKIAFGWS